MTIDLTLTPEQAEALIAAIERGELLQYGDLATEILSDSPSSDVSADAVEPSSSSDTEETRGKLRKQAVAVAVIDYNPNPHKERLRRIVASMQSFARNRSGAAPVVSFYDILELGQQQQSDSSLADYALFLVSIHDLELPSCLLQAKDLMNKTGMYPFVLVHDDSFLHFEDPVLEKASRTKRSQLMKAFGRVGLHHFGNDDDDDIALFLLDKFIR